MTLLGHKGDKEPYCCGVCGCEAGSYGVVPNDRAPIMWLCRDPSCLEIAERIYNMKPRELSRYEELAIRSATAKVLPDLFNALCTILFENGMENLNDLTPEAFDKLCKAGIDGGEVARVVATAFEIRADAIKEQINNNAPPF